MSRGDFLAAWGEERARQFREEVPLFRETDLAVRLRRVLARLRGMAPPSAGRALGRRGGRGPLDRGRDRPGRGRLQPGLRGRRSRPTRRWARCWPASQGDTGWASSPTGRSPPPSTGTRRRPAGCRISRPSSSRSGSARSSPTRRSSGPPRRRSRSPARLRSAPGAILHVGDDWAADVVGGSRAGWRVAWLRTRPADSPLPGSEPDGAAKPDLVIDRLADLEDALAVAGR